MSSPGPDELLAHADFLRALARGLLSDPHRAEDVVQQTYLAAMERPPRHDANLRGWLGAVARNIAAKMRRSEGRRRRRERVAAQAEARPSAAELAAQLDVQRRVVDAVARLDEPYRETVVLRFYHQHPVRDIARMQGVPPNTVRTRLRRALERLRADLDRGDARSHWCAALAPVAALSMRRVPLAEGAILMSTQKKLAISVLVLAALVGTWKIADSWRSSPNERATGRSGTRSASRAPEASKGATGADESETASGGGRSLAIAGRVVTAEGEPVEGARIVVWPEAGSAMVVPGRVEPPAAEVRSRQGGRFTIELAARDAAWVLFAEKRGRGSTMIDNVAPGAELTVELVRAQPLRGRVTDLQGKPVAGARLRWTGCFGGLVLERHATSADDGTYSLEIAPLVRPFLMAVGRGGAAVEVRASGFAPLFVPLDYWYMFIPVRTSQDFVLVRGRTLTGRVLDAATGRALPGARVFVWSERVPLQYYGRNARFEYPYGRRVLAEARAGEGGAFTVSSLPERGFHEFKERLCLGAVAEGYRPASVVAPPGDDAVALPLHRTAVLEGRVVDPRGSALEGVTVRARPTDAGRSPEWPASLGIEEGPLETDADGGYRLAVPRSTVRVSATRDGVTASVEVEAMGDAVTPVPDLSLADPEPPTLSVRVADAAGRPLAEAGISLLPRPAFARTGSDGWARLTPRGAKEGETIVVVARAPGFAPTVSEPFVYSREPTELRLTLRRGARLTGTVSWEDGSAAEPVRLAVFDGTVPLDVATGKGRMEAERKRLAPILHTVAFADAEGRFEFTALPPGPYHVTASWVGSPGARVRATASGVSTEDDLEIILPGPRPELPSAAIEGRVMAEGGGAPPPDYVVWIVQGRSRSIARRVALGRYRWEPLPAGTWTVRASARGFAPFEAQVEVADGETARVDVVFRRGATVRVILPDGVPKGALVGWRARRAPRASSASAARTW